MPWQITTSGGTPVRLDDVPGLRLQAIADRHDSINTWFDLVNTPFMDFAVGLDVIRLAHEIAGEPVPENLNEWTGKDIFKVIENVSDDLPTSFEDGIPKGAGEPETP